MSSAEKRPADTGADEGGGAKRSRTETDDDAPKKRLRIAVVCSSNQNRSMEAHKVLAKKDFDVKSYGTGNHVKVPGKSIEEPNKWPFGEVTYDQMHKELESADRDFYTRNGMLNMLDRNRGIKLKPERFQDAPEKFDVVITCEARVYEQVVEDLEGRDQETYETVHVCNVEIKDNHEEATLGSHRIVELCEMLEEKSGDLENEIEAVLSTYDDKNEKHPAVLYSTGFY